MLIVLGTREKVGKTFVACALIRALERAGTHAAGMIPVETGCGHTEDHDLTAPDGARLGAASRRPLPPLLASPYRFVTKEAPAEAAERAGLRLTLEDLVGAVSAAAHACEALVVEGPGRPDTRISEDATTLDLARALGGPAILVAGFDHPIHPVLEACRRAEVPIAGVVLNAPRPGEPVRSQTFDAPVLASIDHLDPGEDPAERIDPLRLRALRSGAVGR